MKKRIYLLLCFLPLLQASYAQFVINRSYDLSGGPDNAFKIWTDESGYWIDAGRFCEGTFDFCSVLFQANTSGDSLWQVTYDYQPRITIVDYAHDRINNYLYACGEQFGNDNLPFIMKLKENGDTLWLKTYDIPFLDSAQDIEFTTDGNLVIGIQGGSFNEFANWTVLKADTSGAVLWQTTIEDDIDYSYGGQLTVLQDSSIMLAYHYPAPDNHRGYAVSKLSAQGETLWTRRFSEGNTDDYTAFIEALPDGGVAVAWGKDSLNIPLQFKDINFFLQRLDEDGQTEWEFFHRISKRWVYGMTVTENGDIVLCGLTFILDGLNGTDHAWLARFSPQGEMRWERSYLSPTSPEQSWGFQDVTEAPDGGLAMCGFITDTVPNQPGAINDNVWLAKVGPDGCLTPGCQDSIIYITSTREAAGGPAAIKEVFFRAFPNPASGPLQLHFYNPVRYRSARLRVFNMQGQQLWQAPLQRGTSELEVPAGQWPSGLYLLQYEAEGRVLQVEKVVRE